MKKIEHILETCALFMLLSWLGCGESGPADLVLRGGKIATVDNDFSIQQAVAIRGGEIVFVGSDADVVAYVGAGTNVIELDGKLVVPGFIEGHGHYMGLGFAKMVLDLTKAQNWNEIVAMVEDAAKTAPADTWIFGRGWHQEKWNEAPSERADLVPVHTGLSNLSPNNPVYLTHASGHASFANARALEAAGIGKETPDPDGGTIVRDANGNAIGMLRENAQDIVEAAIEKYQAQRPREDVDAELLEQMRLAALEALSNGITSFQDAGSSFKTIDLMKQAADEGELPVRLYVMVRYEDNESMAANLAHYKMIDYANGFLTVRAIKRQVDGALGSHGAWMLEPYTDLQESTGLILEPVEDIARTTELALQHGYQVNTHAIGDRANREILDLYEQALAGNTDLRWRIEHAQHVQPEDIGRFGKLGVIAAIQGVHCTSDGPWVPKRLGDERTKATSYRWRTLWDSGAILSNGTDVPVEDIDPIASYYSTVSRKMGNGEIFYAEERLTREEALKTYTINNAYAAFEEKSKGSIEVGKLADIVVLSQDILTIPEDEIPSTKVHQTIVGGKIVYDSTNLSLKEGMD